MMKMLTKRYAAIFNSKIFSNSQIEYFQTLEITDLYLAGFNNNLFAIKNADFKIKLNEFTPKVQKLRFVSFKIESCFFKTKLLDLFIKKNKEMLKYVTQLDLQNNLFSNLVVDLIKEKDKEKYFTKLETIDLRFNDIGFDEYKEDIIDYFTFLEDFKKLKSIHLKNNNIPDYTLAELAERYEQKIS